MQINGLKEATEQMSMSNMFQPLPSHIDYSRSGHEKTEFACAHEFQKRRTADVDIE